MAHLEKLARAFPSARTGVSILLHLFSAGFKLLPFHSQVLSFTAPPITTFLKLPTEVAPEKSYLGEHKRGFDSHFDTVLAAVHFKALVRWPYLPQPLRERQPGALARSLTSS